MAIIIQNRDDWRHYYQTSRYLERSSLSELKERAEDLFFNVVTEDQNGIVRLTDFPDSVFFSKKITELLTELNLRNEDIRKFLDETGRGHFNFSGCALPHQAPNDRYRLYRFSKIGFLQDTLLGGRIRFRTARGYKDTGLTAAQYDDELCIDFKRPGRHVRIRKQNTDGSYSTPLKIIGDVTESDEFVAHYYISCFSTRYDGRLFDAFDANALLIVDDVKELQRRVWSAFERKFGSDARHADYFVEYIEPFDVPRVGLGVTFEKHFRYAYQKEYRFAFMFPSAEDHEDHFFIEVGSLAGC